MKLNPSLGALKSLRTRKISSTRESDAVQGIFFTLALCNIRVFRESTTRDVFPVHHNLTLVLALVACKILLSSSHFLLNPSLSISCTTLAAFFISTFDRCPFSCDNNICGGNKWTLSELMEANDVVLFSTCIVGESNRLSGSTNRIENVALIGSQYLLKLCESVPSGSFTVLMTER